MVLIYCFHLLTIGICLVITNASTVQPAVSEEINSESAVLFSIGMNAIPCTRDDECSSQPNSLCSFTEKVCKCKDGYEGNTCEVITGCKILGKECERVDAECIFSKNDKDKARCKCRKLKYIYRDKQCFALCAYDDDCENEPIKICTQNACKCTEGYEGATCQTVSGCKILEPECENVDAVCVFDVNVDGKAKCQCRKDKFVYENKQCVVPCTTNEECASVSNTVCNVTAKICKCKEGYEGKYCDVVTGCKTLKKDCEVIEADCIFDEKAENKATCKCRKENFVYSNKQCVVTCTKNEDCLSLSNMVCNMKEKICNCKAGYEGDNCGFVTGCRTLAKHCVRIGADCIFSETDKDKATCKCRRKRTFYKDEGCFALCGHDSDCKTEPIKKCTQNLCKCTKGYEGANCEIVSGCNILKPDCDSADADCIFDANSDLKAKCQCRKNEFVYKNKQCFGPCDSIPCKNGGICSIYEGKAICSCIAPYTGDMCQKSPCDSDLCKNGGSCLIYGGKYICSCIVPYTGDMCQRSPCDLNPCKHRGNCSIIGGKMKCTCMKPYTGDKCEKMSCIDASDCGEREKCNYRQGFCECQAGYEGEKCSIVSGCLKLEKNCTRVGAECVYNKTAVNNASCKCIAERHVFDPVSQQCKDLCQPNPCKNGGSCVTVNSESRCFCQLPFYGSTCQLGNPCQNSPCKNGGSCVVDGLNFKCICKEYFSGSLCGIDVKYKSLFLMNSVLIALILMLLMLIVCNMIRRKTIKRGFPSDQRHLNEKDISFLDNLKK